MFNINERQRQTLLWLAVGLALLAILIVLGPVLTPFIAAIILGYVFLPFVDKLVQRKVPRWLAAAVVMFLAVTAIISLLLLVLPIVQKEFTLIRTQLPAKVTQASAQISEHVLPKINAILGSQFKLDVTSIRQWLTEHVASGGTDIAGYVFTYVKSGWSAALEVLGLFFLVPVVLYYVLLDWPAIRPKLSRLVPPRWRPISANYADEIDGILGKYLRGQMKVMGILAIFYSICLLFAGFDLWLPLGILSGSLVIIPYLGFAMSVVLALGAGVLQFGFLNGLILVAVIYGLGQILESVVLTPKIVGEHIGLHPLAVILALLSFGYLLGFVGVLLALPLAASLAVALRHVQTSYLKSSFYNHS